MTCKDLDQELKHCSQGRFMIVPCIIIAVPIPMVVVSWRVSLIGTSSSVEVGIKWSVENLPLSTHQIIYVHY